MTRKSSSKSQGAWRTFWVAVASIGIVWCGLLWLDVGKRLVERMDRVLHDELLRLGKGAEVREDFILLGIDDASLGNFGASEEELEASPVLRMMQERFPWDRRVWAAAIDRLAEAGARGIVIDLILDAPSDEAADQALAEAIARHKDRVILPASLSPTAQSGGEVFALLEPYDPFLGFDYDTRVGFANFQVDPVDGIIRSARYQTTLGHENGQVLEGEEKIKSLAAQIIDLMGEDVPAGDHGLRFVHSGSRGATEVYAPISLSEIFIEATWESNYGAGAFFKDKVVMIGPVAPRFQDIHGTPVGPLTGPQLHLQAATCGLQRAFLEPFKLPSMPFWASALLSVSFFPRVRRPVVATAGAAVMLTVLLVSATLLTQGPGVWLPVTGAAAAILLPFLFTQSEQLLSEQFERRRLRFAFRRLVSHDVADQLVESPDRYQSLAAGELRDVVILFSDVRGFTSRSENQTPAETVKQLNEYLTAMVSVVFRHGGTLDKFIGDAVMAHWGALDDADQNQHAEAALAAARDMQHELRKLNEAWKREGRDPMSIGIGVHRGEVVVGEIGSEERSEFGVIGDAVNLSSRIEGLCKPFGAELIYSAAVDSGRDAIDLGRVSVKGRREAVQLFGEGNVKRIVTCRDGIAVNESGVRDLS